MKPKRTRFSAAIAKPEGTVLADRTVIYLACCDCGLVHRFVLASKDRKPFGAAMKRDERATAQRRKQTSWKRRNKHGIAKMLKSFGMKNGGQK